MTARDQIARRSQCAARYAAINRGRFARRIRPSKRGWRYAALLPRDGRQDMWQALNMVVRTPDQKRGFWMQAKPKKALSLWYLRECEKIRVFLELPAFVNRENTRKHGNVSE